MTSDVNDQRVHLHVDGWVQGVGFRYQCRHEAKKLGLTGWVRNLDDGRVEVMAEGPAESVRHLADWCRRGPPAARVTQCEQTIEPATGEFDDFGLRY